MATINKNLKSYMDWELYHYKRNLQVLNNPIPTSCSTMVMQHISFVTEAITQALGLLPENIRCFVQLKYMSHTECSRSVICSRLSISERNFHRWQNNVYDILAQCLGLSANI